MRPRLPAVVVAFLAGAAVMAVELLLPRLSARHLGTSAEVWTALFAVVLTGIALGNTLGGRLADARPSSRTEALVLAAAGAAVFAIPALDRLAESALRSLSLLPRAILSMAVCALVPTTLLGAISPILARNALATSTRPGRTLGALAAAGAAGSVLGTYLTGFVLVPRVRVDHGITYVALALALLALGRAFGGAGDGSRGTQTGAVAAPPAPSLSFARAALLVFGAGVALLLVEITAGRVASRLVGNSIYT